MSDIRIASIYAKSLLELAVEKGVLEEILQDVKQLLQLAGQNRELELALKSPIITADKKLSILKAIMGADVNPMMVKFFEIVTRKNRSNVLLKTFQEFEKKYNKFKGIQVAEVTTTFALTDELRSKFIQLVKEISGLEQVQLVERINPDLIGGFILKVNDKQLDDSISSKLRKLRQNFAERHFVKKY
jgi:F-type H+-transporting ATPase subunit delta